MTENNSKQILLAEGTGEIVEKKSRFIAHCFRILSEEEALQRIEELKKQFWDARHNCYAFVCGANNEVVRFSDDKEPQGTAGKPILEVLLNNRMQDTLIIVTRYFGGTLLGTGGLVRAYSAAAAEGLKNSAVSPIYTGETITVICDYSTSGKIQYIAGQLSESGICLIRDTQYSDNVTFRILTENALTELLKSRITEASAGKAEFKADAPASFAVNNGHPVFLD